MEEKKMSDGLFYTLLAGLGVFVLWKHLSSKKQDNSTLFIKRKLLEDLNHYEQNEEYEKCSEIKRKLEKIETND